MLFIIIYNCYLHKQGVRSAYSVWQIVFFFTLNFHVQICKAQKNVVYKLETSAASLWKKSGLSVNTKCRPIYFPAEVAGQAIHGIANSAQILLFWHTLNVAAIPHDPTTKWHQYQDSPSVDEKVPEISPLHFQWHKQPYKQGRKAKNVENNSKAQGHFAVFETHTCHGNCWRQIYKNINCCNI